MKVVLLCRVSTQTQDYTRQVNELTDYCDKANWSIEKVFANKISGAKKANERPEIMEMIDYIQNNRIDKVCVLEISRLGRNTLEALNVIQTYNLKYKPKEGYITCSQNKTLEVTLTYDKPEFLN